MLKGITGRFSAPTGRIAIASGLIVVFVALTIAVVILRFGDSATKYEAALARQPSTFVASDTRTSLYDILNAVRGYDASPTPARSTTAAAYGAKLAGQLRQLDQLALGARNGQQGRRSKQPKRPARASRPRSSPSEARTVRRPDPTRPTGSPPGSPRWISGSTQLRPRTAKRPPPLSARPRAALSGRASSAI